LWRSCRGHFRAQFELDAVSFEAHNAPATNQTGSSNVEFLPNLRSKNPDQMFSMLPSESRPILRDFVGNPAAASHEVREVNPEA